MRFLKLTAMAVLTLSLSVLGCTRGVKKSSSVSLSFKASEVAKMSSELAVLIINVSGPRLRAPIYKPWDRHSCGHDDCVVPQEFVVDDIPAGGEVYVQVLAAFEDTDTEALTFKYADGLKSLVAGTNEISLTPIKIGDASMQAHVYGRYVNEINSGVVNGPTGILDARFKPPVFASVKADPPPVTLMRTPIFAGWTSFFAFDSDDIKFDYFVNSTRILQGINIAKLESMADGVENFLEVDVPNYERNDGSAGLRLERAQKIFIGYLGAGPALANQTACYKTATDEPISDAFEEGSLGLNHLLWNPDGADQTKVRALAGGKPFTSGDAICENPSTEFQDHMVFNHMGLNNGHDGVAGIRGPFRTMTSYGDYVYAENTATGFFVNFNLLPGVASPTGIKSVQVYTRPTPAEGSDSGLYGMGDGIQCSKIIEAGFKLLGEVTVPSGSTGVLTGTYENVDTTSLDIVLCPVLPTGLADAGVRVHNIQPYSP